MAEDAALKSANDDWSSLAPTAVMTVADCRSLTDALAKEMADIESQLDLADARRELGEQLDLLWYAKAKSALRHRGRAHQTLLQRMGDLSRAARQTDAMRLERLFVDAAREMLPQEKFAEIWDAAHGKARAAKPQPKEA